MVTTHTLVTVRNSQSESSVRHIYFNYARTRRQVLVDVGGRKVLKKKKNLKKTTQKQPTRNSGDRMAMACEQEEGCLCLTKKKKIKKKKRDWIFCTNTRDSSSRKEKHTLLEGNFGFLLFKLAKADGTGTVPCGRPFPYFFFLFFFSFFVLWAGSLASKDNFPWTPCANCAVFLLESVYKTK